MLVGSIMLIVVLLLALTNFFLYRVLEDPAMKRIAKGLTVACLSVAAFFVGIVAYAMITSPA